MGWDPGGEPWYGGVSGTIDVEMDFRAGGRVGTAQDDGLLEWLGQVAEVEPAILC